MHLQPRVCDLRGRFVEHASRSGIGIVVENWRIVFLFILQGVGAAFVNKKNTRKPMEFQKARRFRPNRDTAACSNRGIRKS